MSDTRKVIESNEWNEATIDLHCQGKQIADILRVIDNETVRIETAVHIERTDIYSKIAAESLLREVARLSAACKELLGHAAAVAGMARPIACPWTSADECAMAHERGESVGKCKVHA